MVDKTHSNHNPEKIVEFESLLDSVLADENRIWGKKNKPRDQDPSMYIYEILNLLIKISLGLIF